jgi:hypothetical protein
MDKYLSFLLSVTSENYEVCMMKLRTRTCIALYLRNPTLVEKLLPSQLSPVMKRNVLQVVFRSRLAVTVTSPDIQRKYRAKQKSSPLSQREDR